MNNLSSIARRYANALFLLGGGDLNATRRFHAKLSSIRSLFDVEIARKVLLSPAMPQDLKKDLVFYAANLANEKDVTFEAFIENLTIANRFSILPQIADALAILINRAEGFTEVVVISAKPLEDTEAKAIAENIKVSGQISISNRVDPALLGGMVVRVGNKQLDLSLLSRVKETVAAALIV